MKQKRAASGKPMWTVKARKANTEPAVFVVVGTGFGEQTNGGIAVDLHSIPLNWDGKLYMFPVKE